MAEKNKGAKIADDLRSKITAGELKPGDQVPSIPELTAAYGVSKQPVQTAFRTLEDEGLIEDREGRGKFVKAPPDLVIRDSARHQQEKDLVLESEEVRRQHGETEDDLGYSLDEAPLTATFTIVPASQGLASVFGCDPGEILLRQEYERSLRIGGRRLSYSISYVPKRLYESRPDFLKGKCEPWPGGAQHKFHEVGIEISRVVDEVKGVAPSSEEKDRWELPPGVFLLCVRRISYDTDGRVVEVSDAQYPTDRALLRFTTPLDSWKE